MRRFIAAAAVALAGSAAVAAQQEGSLARFSSQVQLVEVYATVTDERGELVTGLRQSDFQVYENNQRQDISTFAAGDRHESTFSAKSSRLADAARHTITRH